MPLDPMTLAQLLAGKGKPLVGGTGTGSGNALTGLIDAVTGGDPHTMAVFGGLGLAKILDSLPKALNAFADLQAQNQPGDLQEEQEQDPAAGGQPQGVPPGGAAGGPPGMPGGQPGANPMAAIMAMMAARNAAQQGGAPGGMPPPAMGSGSPVGGMGPLAALMAARQRMGA